MPRARIAALSMSDGTGSGRDPRLVARVLGDEKLADELEHKGRLRAQSFSWERSVKALHEGYMQVLGAPVPARPAELR